MSFEHPDDTFNFKAIVAACDIAHTLPMSENMGSWSLANYLADFAGTLPIKRSFTPSKPHVLKLLLTTQSLFMLKLIEN